MEGRDKTEHLLALKGTVDVLQLCIMYIPLLHVV